MDANKHALGLKQWTLLNYGDHVFVFVWIYGRKILMLSKPVNYQPVLGNNLTRLFGFVVLSIPLLLLIE